MNPLRLTNEIIIRSTNNDPIMFWYFSMQFFGNLSGLRLLNISGVNYTTCHISHEQRFLRKQNLGLLHDLQAEVWLRCSKTVILI